MQTISVYNFVMELMFAERLKCLRREKGMQQKDLAAALHTTQRKISYWENGKIEPDLAALWKLSDFFDVSVDYLIGKKDY